MTVLISAMMVVIRHYRDVSMLPAAALSAFLCALVVWPWARRLRVTAVDFGWLVLFGTTQFGLGQLLLTIGLRSVSATRSALIGALETPLAPALVWLALGEVPAARDLRRRRDRARGRVRRSADRGRRGREECSECKHERRTTSEGTRPGLPPPPKSAGNYVPACRSATAVPVGLRPAARRRQLCHSASSAPTSTSSRLRGGARGRPRHAGAHPPGHGLARSRGAGRQGAGHGQRRARLHRAAQGDQRLLRPHGRGLRRRRPRRARRRRHGGVDAARWRSRSRWWSS